MSNQVNSLKKGLTVKDLVTTGIFSAIFFVFTLVGGLPFAPNPVLTFYMPMGAALLCGPIYLLMVAKVQKRWSVTILGIIMGIIWFATGMHWAFSLGYIGMGLIADLVAGAGHYRNKAINLLSYMLISLGGIYTYVVFFLDPDGWASTMLKNGTEQSYIDTMNASTVVERDWHVYVEKQKEEDLTRIITEEKLKPEEAKRFVDNSFRDGALKTTGIDFDKIMPPVSRFGSRGKNRVEKKQTIIQKLSSFFEKYLGVA